MNQDLKYMVATVRQIDCYNTTLGNFGCRIPRPLGGHEWMIPMHDPACRAAMRQLLTTLITHTQTEAAKLCPPEPPAEKVQ